MSSMAFGEALQRAQTAFRMGEYTLARRLLEQLREKEADNPVICNLLGSIYEREGEYEKAIGLFEKVIRSRGDNIEACNNLGVAYKNKGESDKALAAFMKVLKMNGRSADVCYNLGNLYKDLNQTRNAIAYYQKAIECDPNYILAYNNLGTVLEKIGRHDDALQVYHKGLQIDTKNPRLHYNSGVIYKNKNRLKEAETEFRLALKHQSGFVAAKNNLALILQSRREYERALQLFREILKTDPANAEAHNNLGVILAEENILDGAREHYEAALKINPGYYKARFNLALLDAAAGAPDEALRELGRLLQEDPGNAEALHQAGLLLLDQGRYDQAEANFRKILEREPDNRGALRALGRIHLKRGRIGPALQIRDRILGVDRDNFDFNLDLAFFYREGGELAKAEEEIRHYLSRHPRHPQASVVLADILLAQKKYDGAQKVLFDVLTTGLREPEILLMLAKVYKEKGLQEDALALLNEIIATQGSSDVIGEVKSLSETIKLYEETVTDYESQFKDQWDKNLKVYKAMYSAPAREIIPSGDAVLFDKALGAAADTVPIINIGGLEPVFEIKEEEEELKLEERDEIIETADDRRGKLVEIEEQGAPSLMSLLDGEPLYEESPQRGRERRFPRAGRGESPEQSAVDQGYFAEEDLESPPAPSPPSRAAEKPLRFAPPPPPDYGAQGLNEGALDQLAGKMKESIESLGKAMKDSILSSALLAQQLKQQPPPSPPPVIMFTQPPLTASDKKKEEAPEVGPSPGEEEEAGWEGAPRIIEEGGGEQAEEEAAAPAGDIPPLAETPVLPEETQAAFAPEVPAAEPEPEEAIAPEEAGTVEGEPKPEGEILVEEKAEDLGREIQEGEAAEEIGTSGTLRDKLKSYVEDVRQRLDEAPAAAAGTGEDVRKPAQPLRLLDYLANIPDYLPQEPHFQFLANEMRVRLEMMRGRLSGRQGLFQRIANSFPGRVINGNNGLTNEKLVSTFSFIKNLSEFIPDPKMSMLLRRKIDGILGKMRGVSVK